MTLAPKTKLLVGLGAFMLIVFGLLSLSGQTFSGDLSEILIPQANPQLCAELEKACTDAGGSGIPCENHAKLCNAILPSPHATAAATTTPTVESETPPADPETDAPARPRRRAPSTDGASINGAAELSDQVRGAAPEQNPATPDITPPPSDADLRALQEAYPEAPSQGPIDDRQLR